MASRFYFSRHGPPVVSPAYAAGWEKTTDAIRRRLVDQQGQFGEALQNGNIIGTTPPSDVLDRQFVSDPLAATTITTAATISCHVQSREFDADANFFPRLYAAIVSNDGLTVRGVLLDVSHYGTSTELDPTTETNRRYALNEPVQIVSNLTVQAGDRLVVEVGYGVDNSPNNPPEARSRFGAPIGSNLATTDEVDQTLTRVPWFEISENLIVGQYDVFPDGIASAEAFGSPAIAIDPFRGVLPSPQLVGQPTTPSAGGYTTHAGVKRISLRQRSEDERAS